MSAHPRATPILICSDIYRTTPYGGRHPLAILRAPAAIDLLRALGWLTDEAYVESPMATPEQLARYHDLTYVNAVMRAEAEGDLPDYLKRRHGLGCEGNAIHDAVFRRPAVACGASLAAAEMLRHGGIVHSPAGGTHHAQRDRAAGFCYFNDPVLAILAFLDQGLERILYIDVDAHHGDGVEAAFIGDARVTTLSVHEQGRWPYTGTTGADDTGTTINLAVPAGFNDSGMDVVVERLLLPLAEHVRPDALVIQGGCDALADDPQSKMMLSNNALWRVIAELRDLAPRLLVLGGGGYNPWCVARCWAGYWALLNGIAIPETLPIAAQDILSELSWTRRRRPENSWLTTLRDAPAPGPVHDSIRMEIDMIRAALGLHGDGAAHTLYSARVTATGRASTTPSKETP